MRMSDLIVKKREGGTLTEEEISFWINGCVSGDIPDYQSSAMCMAILFKGMNDAEIRFLTRQMQYSGDVMDLSDIIGVKVDKHSTGGVGDKTTLVLGPMVAACGAKLAKISGRGLGFTGGTLDKLESIPGLSVFKTEKEFIDQVNKIGLAVVGQSKTLNPADKKLYALRDVTGTVNSIPLIASSVMSKKLASGADAILLDVTVGNGAFMKNIEDARNLATTMVNLGKGLNKNTIAMITDMDQPLGNAVGNILEVKEAISALKGNGPKDLMELCYEAGSLMLVQAKLYKNEKEANDALHKVIEDGSAYTKFLEMVKEQGGDISYIENPDKFNLSKHINKYLSTKTGYISKISAFDIGMSSMHLGAGRQTVEDKIDPTAGIIVFKKVGDYVKEGEPLFEVHTNRDSFDMVIEYLKNAFEFSDNPVEPKKVLIEVIK